MPEQPFQNLLAVMRRHNRGAASLLVAPSLGFMARISRLVKNVLRKRPVFSYQFAGKGAENENRINKVFDILFQETLREWQVI